MKTRNNGFGSRLLMALTFLFLYAPIIILIVFSFNAGNSSSVWKGFSLHWYGELFHNRLIMHSVYITLMVSLLATVIATLAGTFASIGLYSMRRKKRGVLMAVNNIPMMNADIVTGVGLCLLFVVLFNGWGAFAGWVNSWQTLVVLPERLTMGFGTLLLAHICFNIPYIILAVGPKLRQMDRNLIDAAQDLGCTWMQAFWRVVIPEIKPGIVSGALTAFTMSIDIRRRASAPLGTMRGRVYPNSVRRAHRYSLEFAPALTIRARPILLAPFLHACAWYYIALK